MLFWLLYDVLAKHASFLRVFRYVSTRILAGTITARPHEWHMMQRVFDADLEPRRPRGEHA